MAAVFVGGACAVADEHGAGLPVGETYEVAFARRPIRGVVIHLHESLCCVAHR